MNASITHRLIDQGSCKLGCEGRCGSPGYKAKYLTYTAQKMKFSIKDFFSQLRKTSFSE